MPIGSVGSMGFDSLVMCLFLAHVETLKGRSYQVCVIFSIYTAHFAKDQTWAGIRETSYLGLFIRL